MLCVDCVCEISEYILQNGIAVQSRDERKKYIYNVRLSYSAPTFTQILKRLNMDLFGKNIS